MTASPRQNLDRSAFVRHRGPVTCVAPIPHRQAAVTAAYDGAVGYVDLETRAFSLMGYHDHLANKVAVNAAGTKAASCSSDYSIYLWDLDSRERERVLLGHSDDVEDFTFVDDHVGVSVSRDWRILVWNLDTGAITRVIEGHEKDVLSVAAADGRLYTSGDDMTLRVWDLTTGRLLRTWGPFEDETDSCAIDPERGRAILGCDDGKVRIFDIDTGDRIAEIAAHSSGIKRVATSPVNGDILTAAYDQRILVWDAEDLSLRLTLEPRATTWERSFNWSPDGSRIVAGTFDGTVLVWDATTGACLDEIGELDGGNPCLNDVSATDRGDIVTVSDDGVLRLGRLTPDEAVWVADVTPAGGRMLANAVAVDDEYGLAVSGTHDHKLHIFALGQGTLSDEVEVTVGEGPINAVRVSHQPGYEAQLFAACYSGAIARVGRDGTPLGTIRVHEGAVKSLRLHPSEPSGVSCSADGALVSWDYQGRLLQRFPGHMAIVDDVDIDPSGTLITSVSRDFTMKIYRLEDGRLVDSYSLGRRSPKSVCFLTPDVVIVANYWGTLFRFDLSTGEVQSRAVAKNGISAIARCGDRVVVVSYDGAAYLVDPADLRVVNTLRRMTQRLQASALI
jgi:WD40 repeat protein